jgi:hypothetical protein
MLVENVHLSTFNEKPQESSNFSSFEIEDAHVAGRALAFAWTDHHH